MVGNEADDLELVLYGRRVAAAGCTGKRSDFGGVAGLFAFGDLVGDGYGIRCRKANVAAQGIGAKGVLRDKRGGLAVAASGVLGIEPLLDGRLLLDVVGRDDLLVELLLLVGELVARSRCVVRAGPADRTAMSPVPASASAPAAPARATRRESSLLSLSLNSISLPSLNATVVSLICHGVCPALSNLTRSLTNAP